MACKRSGVQVPDSPLNKKATQHKQQAEEALYWQSSDRLRRHPTEEHARTAKRAFLFLAKRHHPDQGSSHHHFLRLKDAYDRAAAAWRRAVA
jgi:hypothetical protein